MRLVLFPLPPWYRKRCIGCGDEKGPGDFYRHPSSRDGLKSYCRECQKGSARASDLRDPQRTRVRKQAWKERHAERVKVAENARRRRKYKAGDAPKLRQRSRAYRIANAEKVAAWWASSHGRMVRRLNAARRLTRQAAAPATLTRGQWEAIVTAFGGACAYCDRPWEEIDHIIPVSRGGGLVAGNVVPACGGCNASKHARPFDDFCRSKGIDSMAMQGILRRAAAADSILA